MSHPTYAHQLHPDLTTLTPKQRVLDVFPEMQAYPVFAEHGAGPAGDPLLKFAFYFAAKGSGLRSLEPARKKEEALRLAGLLPEDPRHAEILVWRHRPAVLLVNEVLRLSYDLDYTVWFHMGLRLYLSAEKMSALINADNDVTGDKEARMYILAHDLMDRVNRQRVEYKALTDELFMSDEELAQASERERLAGAGAVGQRSQKETFVPNKKTIK